jgi:hypothetical protein
MEHSEVFMKKEDNLVLVGFGKTHLIDMIEWIGDKEKEKILLEAPSKLPPIYRRQEICSQEEILAFLEYVGWLNNLIKQYNSQETE